jgi:chromosome segregation ATPase
MSSKKQAKAKPVKQAKAAKPAKHAEKTDKAVHVGLSKKDSNTLVKKVAAVSDSTKTVSKELKSMSKIFADNQKVLISIKDMISTLTDALEQIQKQSKQMTLIEEDNQRLFAGLNQVRSQASIISKISDHASKLQAQVDKISQAQKESPDPESILKAVADSQNSIQNNTHMIIKIAQRIDKINDDLGSLSGEIEKSSSVGNEIERLREKIQLLHEQSAKSNLESEVISLKQSLAAISEKTEGATKIMQDLESIQNKVNAISDKAEKIESLGNKVQQLQEELSASIAKAEAVTGLSGQLRKLESEIESLVKRADSTAFVGEGLRTVQEDLGTFKDNIFNKTNTIDQKVSTMAEMLKRTDASMSEFHKKTDSLFHGLSEVTKIAGKSSSDTSKEMTALLKLSEFQSNIRIISESKYGELKDIEKMAEQTASIVNLFDKVSIESEQKVTLPPEVRQWAISKMLDCADKWEIRFSDLFSIMTNKLGKELVKENIRIQQVRDIFGIRGVDEIRKELNLTS